MHSDNVAEKVRTRPLLLPKPKKVGVVSSKDLAVLVKALGAKTKGQGQVKASTPPMTLGKMG